MFYQSCKYLCSKFRRRQEFRWEFPPREKYFQTILRQSKLTSLTKSLYLYTLYTTNCLQIYFLCAQLYSFCRESCCQGLRKAPIIQDQFLSARKSKESGRFRLFARYGTFSWITEKYDVTPLFTQLPAHSSPSFTELPRAVLQAAFVQSRIAVCTHALACALLFSTQNWVPR